MFESKPKFINLNDIIEVAENLTSVKSSKSKIENLSPIFESDVKIVQKDKTVIIDNNNNNNNNNIMSEIYEGSDIKWIF